VTARARAPGSWAGWVAIGLVAAAARLLALFAATDANAVQSDALHYHEIATNLAAGDGFSSTYPQLLVHPTAFRPPLYPALLAGLYRITGPSVLGGKLLDIAIGVAVVVLAGRLVARTVDVRAGWIAGGLLALYPPLIANDITLLTEPITLLLLVLLAGEVGGRARWWLVGIETAALVLTRPSAPIVVLVVGVFLWRRVGPRRALGAGAVAVLCLVPWSLRNHAQVGTWNLTTSNGFNLAAMYSAPARERHGFVDTTIDPAFDAHRLAQFDEASWDADMRRIGAAGARDAPGYVAFVVARNGAAITELRPSYNDAAERFDGRNMTVRAASLPLFYVVTALGVWGLVRARHCPAIAFLATSAAAFLAVSLFTIAVPRLRAPADLACCIGAAVVLAGLRRRPGARGAVATGDEEPIDQDPIDEDPGEELDEGAGDGTGAAERVVATGRTGPGA
jgi:4-amino-4-deoxy-L-arabinose transferase-like glycosyltransferase